MDVYLQFYKIIENGVVTMLEWVFDGIGTEIVSLVVGAVAGGAIGYKIGVKNRSKQVQKAGDDAQQKQNAKIGDVDVHTDSAKISSKIKQVQKAGDHASQVQIGGINDGQ